MSGTEGLRPLQRLLQKPEATLHVVGWQDRHPQHRVCVGEARMREAARPKDTAERQARGLGRLSATDMLLTRVQLAHEASQSLRSLRTNTRDVKKFMITI